MSLEAIYTHNCEGIEFGRQGMTFNGPSDERPELTIVVTTHNKEPFLPDLVDSINAQEIDVPFEVVAVDDASTDDSFTCLTDVGNINTARLAENSGSGAVPFGVAAYLARSNVVAFLDGDDYLGAKDTLASTAALFKDPNVVFAHSNFIFQRQGRGGVHENFDWTVPGEYFGTDAYDPSETGLIVRGADEHTTFAIRPAREWDILDTMTYPHYGGLRTYSRKLLEIICASPPVIDRSIDHELVLKSVMYTMLEDPTRKIASNPVDGYVYRVHGNNQTIQDLRDPAEQTRNFVLPYMRQLGMTWDEVRTGAARQIERGTDSIIQVLGLEERHFS